MLGLISHAAGGGGAGFAAGPAHFGLIYDIQGKVDMKRSREEPVRLKSSKDILRVVKDGDKIKTEEDGKLILVSLSDKIGYELMPNTLVMITANKITTVRGTVNKIEGLYTPKSIPAQPEKEIMVSEIPQKVSCLSTVSPLNTSIITTTPTLKWENSCEGSKKVTVKLISDRRVIYQAITGDTYMKIPKEVLNFEQTCIWIIHSGETGIVGSTFSILSEDDVKEALEMKYNYVQHEGEMHQYLSYVFYLKSKGLREMADTEITRIKKDFPENTHIQVR
jgi:hypothetical protein